VKRSRLWTMAANGSVLSHCRPWWVSHFSSRIKPQSSALVPSLSLSPLSPVAGAPRVRPVYDRLLTHLPGSAFIVLFLGAPPLISPPSPDWSVSPSNWTRKRRVFGVFPFSGARSLFQPTTHSSPSPCLNPRSFRAPAMRPTMGTNARVPKLIRRPFLLLRLVVFGKSSIHLSLFRSLF